MSADESDFNAQNTDSKAKLDVPLSEKCSKTLIHEHKKRERKNVYCDVQHGLFRWVIIANLRTREYEYCFR